MISISFIFCLSSFSQTSKYLYDIDSNGDLKATCQSVSSYKKMTVNLQNKSNQDFNIEIPCGTYFVNSRVNEQNLVVLFEESILNNKGERVSIDLITACMDASKASPSSHSKWKIENDRALGDLIRFYHSNRSIVSMMTGSEHHLTKEKQADFLQMSVWAYFNADKKHILNFATKYMFDGNKEQAEVFVDTTLPLIQIFTNYYKSLNK